MKFPRFSLGIIIGSFVILLVSYVGFMHPTVNAVSFLLIIACVIVATWVKFEFGVLLAIWELMLGGHGYLFSIDLFGFSLSLRIAIFFIITIFWSFHFLRFRKTPAFFQSNLRIPFVLVFLFIVYGVIRGFFLNQPSIVYADANGYIAICYIVFFVDALKNSIQRARLIRFVLSVMIALAAATIIISGVFTVFHYDATLGPAASVNTETYKELSQIKESESEKALGQRLIKSPGSLTINPLDVTKTKPSTYRWLRDTGTAEVTYVSGRFFRVFFPSHFFLALLIFPFLGLFIKNFTWGRIVPMALVLIALVISYSRSLWAGMAMSILCWLLYMLFRSRHKKTIFITIGATTCLVILLFGLHAFQLRSSALDPILHPTQTVSGAHRIELVRGIFNAWQQHPILGSGFGALVNFATILPEGELIYTSFYVYEWAYFDIAVKLGTIGLLIFLLFLFTIFKHIARTFFITHDQFAGGLFFGLITLAIANIFTPVFTHPLGLSALALILMYTISLSYDRTTKNSAATRNLE